jgi:hypothetical protein
MLTEYWYYKGIDEKSIYPCGSEPVSSHAT